MACTCVPYTVGPILHQELVAVSGRPLRMTAAHFLTVRVLQEPPFSVLVIVDGKYHDWEFFLPLANHTYSYLGDCMVSTDRRGGQALCYTPTLLNNLERFASPLQMEHLHVGLYRLSKQEY